MTVIDRAKMFILKQRIRELENAIRHWPNSPSLDIRKLELTRLKEDLRELEIGYTYSLFT